MNNTMPTLIIPVENQVRELEPKILLACIGARRGFECLIGSRLEVDFHIAKFPRGIYLSKSMTARSVKMFRIMRMLGHRITVWDEEALVHPPAETYFTRRLSAAAIRRVSHLFAWGEENTALWRSYPDYPGTPIHITGNPRGDMLRPELQEYYRKEVDRLKQQYGDFLLVNTNFGTVNAFNPGQNLFVEGVKGSGRREYGRGAVGMRREYAEGLSAHKQALFEAFLQVIPRLERTFPGLNIVIRPHPVEDPTPYHRIAEHNSRVQVDNCGNVIPWLMAGKALIHNGCTTGVEAYMLGTPAIAYRPSVDRYFDSEVFGLPNRLSHQCFDFDELVGMLNQILEGTRGAAGGDERKALFSPYLTAGDGRLASERIVDVLETIGAMPLEEDLPREGNWLGGWRRATWRRLVKRSKGYLPGSKYRPEFQRHRYPGLTLEEMKERVERFQGLLGDEQPLRVELVREHIYRIVA